MPQLEHPPQKISLPPIPLGCLTTLVLLPSRMFILPFAWIAARFTDSQPAACNPNDRLSLKE